MDYELKPLGKICSKTGKPFGPGDVCYSTVIEKGNEWVRLDFSAGAWTGPPEGGARLLAIDGSRSRPAETART